MNGPESGDSFAICRTAILILAVALPCASLAAESVPDITPAPPRAEAEAPAPQPPKPVLSWETGAGKSYAIPAAEIFGFDFLLNQFNRHHIDHETYSSNFSSFRRNLGHSWVVDTDPFATNQFLHPYQGSMYHGFARSAGLGYWDSLGYTFAGSLLWETAGETTLPSKNDQIASGIAGTFLGEPLFRMANLLLEKNHSLPPFWRELGAAAISPPTGFNRLAFGNRFDALFPSHDPAFFTRLQLGASLTSRNEQGTSQDIQRKETVADFLMAYGLPGKPGYSYTRPFDYFNFEFTAASGNIFENIMSRGLLAGKDYSAGNNYRGVWGLYGSYDYFSPQIFRVSSTAVSLGTTAQWWLSKTVALQGTILGGVGYGAAGTIHGVGERDYHYGLTPQALVALRLIFGNVAAIDVTGRDYYVSRVASTESRGWEKIARAEASLTVRVIGHHGIALKYLASRRHANYPDLGDRLQSRDTVSLYYTYLSDERFGAVEWRGADDGRY